MNSSSNYNPKDIEDKWYDYWYSHGLFNADINPKKEPYTIVMPPPNVTGVLHMGHMLNNTVQDILVRKARMEQKNACWVAGTDHASIATEARVVAMLREKNIRKADLSRKDFLEYVWAWKEKYGSIILEQLKKIGVSCDWRRTTFTMDTDYHKAVLRVFVDLYNKGYIYRGQRMIHWDTEAKTALSNEEVIYKEDGEESTLYEIKYNIKDSKNDCVVVATQRPETLMGDVAIAVNPSDERYQSWVGKEAIVPFVERVIPIIADNYVDPSFGTGCLKITPAHDVNDYEIGMRFGLKVIDTINDDGTLNEKCGINKYVGKDRFVVRKAIVKDLHKADLLVSEKKFITRIGRSERTQSIVEPKISLQWFIKMEKLAPKALQAVEKGIIQLHPSKFKNTYRHWMGNIRDWCVSRQLWWGHRIPAYFYGKDKNDFVVAETIEEAASLASKKCGIPIDVSALQQDPDTLDTWASSWLWPMGVFNGFNDASYQQSRGKIVAPSTSDLGYFYPTNVLVTAPEILFFWVARMIIAGYSYTDKHPFDHVYLTGIVKDKKGRKMSKSLGNSPDPMELIEKYGADGVRVGMLLCSPAGNDLLFDVSLCEQGRNFANKIWNAFRLFKRWHNTPSKNTPKENLLIISWFDVELNQSIKAIDELFKKFRLSESLMLIYKLFWDDFCARYLEIIKPTDGLSIDETTYAKTITFFEVLLKIIHPFMPFITEELWHNLSSQTPNTCLTVAHWPQPLEDNQEQNNAMTIAFEIISQMRNIRQSKRIHHKEKLDLIIEKSKINNSTIKDITSIIKKAAHLKKVSIGKTSNIEGIKFMVQTTICVVPFLKTKHDATKEHETLIGEIAYTESFLKKVNNKLDNYRFIENAPDQIVALERKKREDALLKIEALKKNLLSLKKSK